MYKFTQDVHHLGMGKDFRKGQAVPADFPNIQYMIDQGAVELVETAEIEEIIADQEGKDYSDMTVVMLADELRERNMKIGGSKDEKIERLLEDDK